MSKTNENPYLAPLCASNGDAQCDPRPALVCAAISASLSCLLLFHFANPLASFNAWTEAILVATVATVVFSTIYKRWKSASQRLVFCGGLTVGLLSVLVCTIPKWIQVREIVRTDDLLDLGLAMLIFGCAAGFISPIGAFLGRRMLPWRTDQSH